MVARVEALDQPSEVEDEQDNQGAGREPDGEGITVSLDVTDDGLVDTDTAVYEDD